MEYLLTPYSTKETATKEVRKLDQPQTATMASHVLSKKTKNLHPRWEKHLQHKNNNNKTVRKKRPNVHMEKSTTNTNRHTSNHMDWTENRNTTAKTTNGTTTNNKLMAGQNRYLTYMETRSPEEHLNSGWIATANWPLWHHLCLQRLRSKSPKPNRLVWMDHSKQ